MTLILEDKRARQIKSREEIGFSSFSSFHLVSIAARAKSEKQISEGATDDEELVVKVDDKVFPKLGTKEALLDSPASFNGGKLHNLTKTVYFLTFLRGRKHTIGLSTDKEPYTVTFENLQINAVETFHLEKDYFLTIENQAEDGDRRPWIAFVLDNLPLKSFTSTITYFRRKRDSDDVKITVDGQTYGNIQRTIKHFLWRYAGFLLPKLFPTKTEKETFTANLPAGLHYLEFEADRMPILHSLSLDFGGKPSLPAGIPTVENPKWTGIFYDDTPDLLLARVIYGEAGGETWEAKVGVGWTVRNRVEDAASRWGKTYHSAILAEGQYDSLWNERTYDKVRDPLDDPLEKRAWEESCEASGRVIEGEVGDPTIGANHFYATTISKPDWADDAKFTVQIGITRFYKL